MTTGRETPKDSTPTNKSSDKDFHGPLEISPRPCSDVKKDPKVGQRPWVRGKTEKSLTRIFETTIVTIDSYDFIRHPPKVSS